MFLTKAIRFNETYPHRHIIRLREDVYEQAIAGDGFARMTLAHEVGHLLEHSDAPLAMARRPASDAVPAYRGSEWQANAFAGALLMPACRIVDMGEPSIASKYQVSITAATLQKRKMQELADNWTLPQL